MLGRARASLNTHLGFFLSRSPQLIFSACSNSNYFLALRNSNSESRFSSSSAAAASLLSPAAVPITAKATMRPTQESPPKGSASNPVSFLEMLRKQIDANLAHHKPGECPLTKKDILDLGQLQKEIEFQEDIHGVSQTLF